MPSSKVTDQELSDLRLFYGPMGPFRSPADKQLAACLTELAERRAEDPMLGEVFTRNSALERENAEMKEQLKQLFEFRETALRELSEQRQYIEAIQRGEKAARDAAVDRFLHGPSIDREAAQNRKRVEDEMRAMDAKLVEVAKICGEVNRYDNHQAVLMRSLDSLQWGLVDRQHDSGGTDYTTVLLLTVEEAKEVERRGLAHRLYPNHPWVK